MTRPSGRSPTRSTAVLGDGPRARPGRRRRRCGRVGCLALPRCPRRRSDDPLPRDCLPGRTARHRPDRPRRVAPNRTRPTSATSTRGWPPLTPTIRPPTGPRPWAIRSAPTPARAAHGIDHHGGPQTGRTGDIRPGPAVGVTHGTIAATPAVQGPEDQASHAGQRPRPRRRAGASGRPPRPQPAGMPAACLLVFDLSRVPRRA